MTDSSGRNEFEIAGRRIGENHPPYIIAEMSANHDGDLGKALAIIAAAKDAGADAVKLQTYRADTITLDSDRPEFQLTEGKWAGRSLFQLYEEATTPWEWHEALFQKGVDLGIPVFSSPFDWSAVDFLESFDCPAYKIASPELIDLPLIRRAAETGKPIIMSTGMATLNEVIEASECARKSGAGGLAVLHCVSGYPTPIAESNLMCIPALADATGAIVGLSDHTLGTETAIASTVLGGRVIEKHFTLSRADDGLDASFSLEPEEFRTLCDGVRAAFGAMGCANFDLKPSEVHTKKFRRSLYVIKDVKAGETFTHDNVRSVRPANGLAPKHLDDVIGKVASVDVAAATPLEWSLVSG